MVSNVSFKFKRMCMPLYASDYLPIAGGGGNDGGLSPAHKHRVKNNDGNYRGVSCYKRTGRWEAHIWEKGKQVHLGSFRDPDSAVS